MRDMDAETPPRLHDRAADNWRTLFVIAARIGGEWPEKLRAAALALEGIDTEAEPEVEVSAGVRLLADCKEVFENRDASELSAREIINDLCNADESHWSDHRGGKAITETAFAKLLKPFGITSKMGSAGARKGKKFWRRDSFKDTWKRYLPKKGGKFDDQASTPYTLLKNKETFHFGASTAVEGDTDEKLNKINEVEGVEGQRPNFLPSAGHMPKHAQNGGANKWADAL